MNMNHVRDYLITSYDFDPASNLWHRSDASPFSYSDGDEVEDRIYSIIKESSDRSSSSIELQKSITDWPTNYHFNSRRANLMRPIRHLLKGSILEIGAGTGAVTRFLGENGGQILAIEGSGRRAAIAATRCADLSNVTVVADDFAALPSGPKFDVVTLIGVLEYARIFFKIDDSDPVAALIAHARSFLRPGGILIVAIENQLGLKYFAGCAEDHTSKSMFGVEDLYRGDTVVTFGRAELSRRLADGGLPHQQWWFPLPDYKLPVSVLSDQALRHEVDLSALLAEAVRTDPQITGPLAFSLERAWGPVFRNGLLGDLANSFLVLSSDEALPDHDVLGVHYGTSRRPEFSKEVRFEWQDGTVRVCRSRLNHEPGANPSELISLHLADEPFLPERTWHAELISLWARAGWTLEEWRGWARRWLDAVLALTPMPAQPAPPPAAIVPGHLVDAIPRNMVLDGKGTPHFFDQEWRLNEPVEIGFIAYRGIYDSLDTLVSCAKPAEGVSLSKMSLFQDFTRSLGWQVTADDIRRYTQLEGRIQATVSGASERPLSSLYDTVAVHLGFGDMKVNCIQALQQQLVESQAEIQQLTTSNETRENEHQASLRYISDIEEKLATSTKTRENERQTTLQYIADIEQKLAALIKTRETERQTSLQYIAIIEQKLTTSIKTRETERQTSFQHASAIEQRLAASIASRENERRTSLQHIAAVEQQLAASINSRQNEHQASLQHIAAIERQLAASLEAHHEVQRQLIAMKSASDWLASQLCRAYFKPWHPLRQGIQRLGLHTALFFKPVLSRRGIRRFRKSLLRREPVRFQLEWERRSTLAAASPAGEHAPTYGEQEFIPIQSEIYIRIPAEELEADQENDANFNTQAENSNELYESTNEPDIILIRTDQEISLEFSEISSFDSQSENDIALIENHQFFDDISYSGTAEAAQMGMSPLAHYVKLGEARGLAPSRQFDPTFYRRRYPDIVERCLVHYICHGRDEGRSPFPVARRLNYPVGTIDPRLPTVVILVHEASRTGAPILAWNIVRSLRQKYNVVVFLQRPGALTEAFEMAANAVVTMPINLVAHEAEFEELARELISNYNPIYVIANSVESRSLVPAFEENGVPVIALVHEFSNSHRPLGILYGLFKLASQVVFPAQIVADSALTDHRHLIPRRYTILPQGHSEVPPQAKSAETGFPVADPRILKKPGLPEHGDIDALPPHDGTLLVAGMGTITPRKGVDVFLSAAAEVVRRRPDLSIEFAWAGEAFTFDQSYVDLLEAQVERSGLAGRFRFLGAFSDLEPLYARTDIMVLSSRLDPLPNVSIDCALHGIPVLCFENAGGMAELLLKSEDTRKLVVPYLDAGTLAERIVELASDTDLRRTLSQAVREIGDRTFDMQGYVDAIDNLGQASLHVRRQTQIDFETIGAASVFNATLYQPGDTAQIGGDEALWHYLQASRHAVPRGEPYSGYFVRRPLEGFHPLIYAEDNAAYDETTGEDPLAHYLRSGSPRGRWLHQTITPQANPPSAPSHLRVAMHGHFHYPELLPEFLGRLSRNRVPCDLFLTTSSEERRLQLQRSLEEFGMRGTVMVVPNKGRDIGPLLNAFSREQLFAYDIIGHVHGKRSPHADGSLGDVWRTFLWEHLVGGDFAMLDEIAAAFEADPRLGLVFPEDPNLCDWTENREIAEALAARMGIDLTNHFDFPIGTMFWARPEALRPLFDLNLTWDDYPAEPLPIDGTMLHVLERMIPFAARKAGYDYATTYVKNHRR